MGGGAVGTMTASGTTPSRLRGEGWGAGRKLRSTLLGASRQESLNAVDELLAPRLRLLQVGLEFERFLVARLQRVVDRALRGGQRLARLRRELRSKLAHLLLEALLRNHTADDSEPMS